MVFVVFVGGISFIEIVVLWFIVKQEEGKLDYIFDMQKLWLIDGIIQCGERWLFV